MSKLQSVPTRIHWTRASLGYWIIYAGSNLLFELIGIYSDIGDNYIHVQNTASKDFFPRRSDS